MRTFSVLKLGLSAIKPTKFQQIRLWFSDIVRREKWNLLWRGQDGGISTLKAKKNLSSHICTLLLDITVKLSLYRTGPALRAPGFSGFYDL
jgi:hypothetical protein